MATKTLGTNGTTTLPYAIQWTPGFSPADVATIQEQMLDDVNVAHPIWPGAFSNNGLLFIPNRGVLKVLPGDWIGVGTTGWPILVAAAAETADWTTS